MSFGSDNHAGVLPEVLDAIRAANDGHALSYGYDPWTVRMEERFREHFGPDAQTFLVFNGTAANVVGLRALCRPWDAVVCTEAAHLNVDEGGAPERIGGFKLIPIQAPGAKLTPQLVEPRLVRFGAEHAVQPRVISITQTTELGPAYTVEEVRALADLAHAHDMLLHVDGARLANAAATLHASLYDLTTGAGADAVSFGGTKTGMLAGDAIVLLRPELAEGARYLRKQSMQLASKMRFLAAQFDALLTDHLWLRAAGHANAMATRLAVAVRQVPGVTITQPVQANAVFAILPPEITERLQRDFAFYVWDETTGEVRWMCSWDTTEEDVDAFASAIASALAPA